MNDISSMMLYGAFGSGRLSKTETYSCGVKDSEFKKSDTDNNGQLTLSEILENDDICSRLLQRINAIQSVLVNTNSEESKLQKEKNLLKENTTKYPEFDGFKVLERSLVFQA